jgi:hypothetical protein
MSLKYTNNFHCKTLQNFTQIAVFGLKLNHLATLAHTSLWTRFISRPFKWKCLFSELVVIVEIFFAGNRIFIFATAQFCERARPYLGLRQGDQIGRISAQWVIVYFGLFLWKFQKWPTFLGYFFPQLSWCINFDKMYWATFWAICFTNSSGHPGLRSYRQRKKVGMHFDKTTHRRLGPSDKTNYFLQGQSFHSENSNCFCLVSRSSIEARPQFESRSTMPVLLYSRQNRCYDFLNIFAEKFGEQIGVFGSIQS